LPPGDRKDFGQSVNRARDQINDGLTKKGEVLAARKQLSDAKKDRIDVTLPGRRGLLGGVHPITRTVRRIQRIFQRAGFDVTHGPEIEDDFHNFEALNIP